MSAPFVLTPVRPLGATLDLVPVRGRAREFYRYPPSPRGERPGLRRGALGMRPRDAAAALGVTTDQLADLEQGRTALADDAEWDRAEALLREAAREPSAVDLVAAAMRGSP